MPFDVCFTVYNSSKWIDNSLYFADIISKNRNGVTENFPIASLSIAGISSAAKKYDDIDEFSQDIAQLKKKCKQHPGNYAEIL